MKNLFFLVEALFLLALVVGGIITIWVTRKKENPVKKTLYYVGIEVICVVAISFIPLLLKVRADFIIIGLLVALAIIYFKHHKK